MSLHWLGIWVSPEKSWRRCGHFISDWCPLQPGWNKRWMDGHGWSILALKCFWELQIRATNKGKRNTWARLFFFDRLKQCWFNCSHFWQCSSLFQVKTLKTNPPPTPQSGQSVFVKPSKLHCSVQYLIQDYFYLTVGSRPISDRGWLIETCLIRGFLLICHR